MVELCAQTGYQAVSVASVSARAGVSTQTFYELFGSREDCLLAACGAAAERVFDDEAPPSNSAGGEHPVRVAIDGLLGALERDLDATRLLFVEALAGGALVRAELDAAYVDFERTLEPLLDGSRVSKPLDVPAAALLGAVRGLVSRELRAGGEPQLRAFSDDLWLWLSSYALPSGTPRSSVDPWMLLSRAPADCSKLAACPPDLLPQQMPRGRHRLAPAVAGRIHRTRILHGTARAMLAKGYADVAVKDIVSAAGIARNVFYDHFTSKQDAFLAAQQHGNAELLHACADAYFAAARWPERVWNVLCTLSGLVAANPAFASVRLVDCYAAGFVAVDHVQELQSVVSIIVAEGYHGPSQARQLPALCADAIAAALFALVQRDVARGDAAMVARRLPQLTYVVLAPFMGPRAASRVVGELAGATAASSGSAPGSKTLGRH